MGKLEINFEKHCLAIPNVEVTVMDDEWRQWRGNAELTHVFRGQRPCAGRSVTSPQLTPWPESNQWKTPQSLPNEELLWSFFGEFHRHRARSGLWWGHPILYWEMIWEDEGGLRQIPWGMHCNNLTGMLCCCGWKYALRKNRRESIMGRSALTPPLLRPPVRGRPSPTEGSPCQYSNTRVPIC
jgi:hypothetical protein